jgi:hypothetical protein
MEFSALKSKVSFSLLGYEGEMIILDIDKPAGKPFSFLII